MIAEVTAHFGKIDVLVNNAGVSSFGLVTDITSDEWKRIFDVNVYGTFLTVKYVLPQMISRKLSMFPPCGGGAAHRAKAATALRRAL